MTSWSLEAHRRGNRDRRAPGRCRLRRLLFRIGCAFRRARRRGALLAGCPHPAEHVRRRNANRVAHSRRQERLVSNRFRGELERGRRACLRPRRGRGGRTQRSLLRLALERFPGRGHGFVRGAGGRTARVDRNRHPRRPRRHLLLCRSGAGDDGPCGESRSGGALGGRFRRDRQAWLLRRSGERPLAGFDRHSRDRPRDWIARRPGATRHRFRRRPRSRDRPGQCGPAGRTSPKGRRDASGPGREHARLRRPPPLSTMADRTRPRLSWFGPTERRQKPIRRRFSRSRTTSSAAGSPPFRSHSRRSAPRGSAAGERRSSTGRAAGYGCPAKRSGKPRPRVVPPQI